MNYKQFVFAREYRGYNQTELSNYIEGLSQSNLSKFEKGLGILSENVIDKIIEFLDFPRDFFNRKISNTIDNANYRKKATPKYLIDEFEGKCKIVGYIIDQFTDEILWPVFSLSPLNVEDGFPPAKVASYTRKLMKLSPEQPVRDIFTIFEYHGVICYELDGNNKFDGVSFISDFGTPVIIVNKNMSNDRKRFTLAHELGHILMHNESNFPVSDYRDKEKEANEFASEFLMPESAIKNTLYSLKLSDLSPLKQYWLTSMSSIIRRAKDLKCIDESRYKYFMIEFSRLGLTKNEGSNVVIDSPEVLVKSKELLENELGYTEDDFQQALSLPKDVLNELLPNRNTAKILKLRKM